MYTIYHDVFIKSSREEIFQKISAPEHLANWWPLRCSGKQELGAKYNFFFEAPYDWWGRVEQYVPAQSFHIKMTEADEDWTPTTFGFDLRREKNGVWVEFWHKGWPKVNHHFRRSSHCWAMLLQGLKEYVEDGKIIPFDSRS